MNVVYVEFCQSSTPCLHCHEYCSQFMRGFQIFYVQIIWLKTAQGKLDFKYFRNWYKKGRKGVMTFALSLSYLSIKSFHPTKIKLKTINYHAKLSPIMQFSTKSLHFHYIAVCHELFILPHLLYQFV